MGPAMLGGWEEGSHCFLNNKWGWRCPPFPVSCKEPLGREGVMVLASGFGLGMEKAWAGSTFTHWQGFYGAPTYWVPDIVTCW